MYGANINRVDNNKEQWIRVQGGLGAFISQY